MTEKTNEQELQEIGANAYESIKEIVDALTVDYDRLEELRGVRQAFIDDWEDENEDTGDADNARSEWETAYPDEAQELAELEEQAGDCDDQETARRRIEEDPLSLRIFGERTNGEWEADNYELLLSTGGPATRIVGEIGNSGDPSTARLEVQGWFTPWTEFHKVDRDILLAYASVFYMGE